LGSGRANPLGYSVGNAHSHRGEARGQAPLHSLAPAVRGKRWFCRSNQQTGIRANSKIP
jgi:hypothetical protein